MRSQDSVLGSLLLLIYIMISNDIVFAVEQDVYTRLFTDDCVLFREMNTLSDQACSNNDFETITTWCTRWDMQLNIIS